MADQTVYMCFHVSLFTGSFFTGSSLKNNEEVSLIRKADLENHNKDGGFWTVIEGKVYDIKDFQAQSLTGNTILGMKKFHMLVYEKNLQEKSQPGTSCISG